MRIEGDRWTYGIVGVELFGGDIGLSCLSQLLVFCDILDFWGA